MVDSVHNSLTTKNPDYIYAHVSQHLKKDLDMIDSVVSWQLVSPDGIAQIDDQFYIENFIKVVDPVNRVKGQYAGNNYTFFFQPMSEETYVVNYTTASPEHVGKMLVSLVFGKEKGDWKIQLIQIGNIELAGKNAMDYIQQAKKYYEEDNFVAAYMSSEYAAMLARPAGNLFHYELEDDIENGYRKSRGAFEKKYTMPLFADGLNPQPVISSMQAYIEQRRAHPMPEISYTYNKPVSSYEEENLKLHQHIEQVLPGIKDIADSIAYSVTYKNNEGATETKTFVRGFE